MEETTALAQPWYRRKPILVFAIAYYSLFAVIFLGIFVSENFEMVHFGVVSLPNFLSYCLPNAFIGIAGALLYLRRKSSLYFFAAALVVGTARLLAVGTRIHDSLFLILPSILGFSLIFGIVIYCLHLKDEGYFK